MAKYLDASGVSTLWSKAKNTFASLSHTHIKITHSFWSYSDAISEDATPKEIGDYFGIPASSYNAVFTAVTKNSSGSRWQNLYWTNYGEAGLVELGKSYGGGDD